MVLEELPYIANFLFNTFHIFCEWSKFANILVAKIDKFQHDILVP